MSDNLTPAQLDEIEAVAKKATPGPFYVEVESVGDLSLWSGDDYVGQVRMGEDALYVAMMDPATTLALVAEVRELRAKVERVREIIDGPDYAEAQLALVDEALGEEA